MDPLTLLTIAQVGIAAGSTVWNYFSGQSQLAQARKQQEQSQKFFNEQKTQTLTAIDRAASGNLAGLAQGGVIGLPAQQTVDTLKADQTKAADLQFRQQQAQLDQGAASIETQANQFNTDFLTGMLGIGLTGASQILRGTDLTTKSFDTNWNTGYKDIGKGIGIPGTGSGGYSLPKPKPFSGLAPSAWG